MSYNLHILNYVKENNIKYRLVLLTLFAFFMPISQKISTILIIINIVFALKDIKKINSSNIVYFFLFFGLYFLYAIAYYRDNFEFGMHMFEQKASFAAFPLILFGLKKERKYVEIILKAFVIGSVIAYVLAVLNAFWNAIDFSTFTFNIVHETAQDKDVLSYFPLQTNYFLGNYFSFSMQSNMLALYFVFSVGIMHFYKSLFHKKFRIIGSVLLALGVIQLFSLMGVLSLLVLGLYILYLKNKKYFFVLIAIMGIAGIIVNKGRISKIVTSSDQERKEELIKLNERAIIWSTAAQVIATNPLVGSGIRKAQQKLNKLYPKEGDFGERSQLKNLHAHNTFLQTTLETGIIGLLVLLSALFLFIKRIRKSTNTILKHIATVFIALILLNFLSESVFNIYVGISFFMFFYCLLSLFNENEKKVTQELA